MNASVCDCKCEWIFLKDVDPKNRFIHFFLLKLSS